MPSASWIKVQSPGMVYRRRINTYVWHFSPLCPAWPGELYEERHERSANDPLDLCSECTTLVLTMGRCPRVPPGSKEPGSN